MPTNIERVLDQARWAPSGDNEQPWRVRITSPDTCEITVGYFLDTLFHLDRRPDHIALGIFLETLHIAASKVGLVAHCVCKNQEVNAPPLFEIALVEDASIKQDLLAEYIEQRAVNRFPYSRKALSSAQKQQVQDHLPLGYRMMWIEGKQQFDFAKLVFRAGIIRYVLPEMFAVHSKIVDWKNVLSPDKVPAKAMGVPTIFLPLIKWLLSDRKHMEGYNKFFMGDVSTALQLEFLPSICSGAGIAIVAEKEPRTPLEWVLAGRAIQRFWLAATAVGLSHQPAFTPLIFSKYADQGLPLTTSQLVNQKNVELSADLSRFFGGVDQKNMVVWMGRVGFAKPVTSRSVRRNLEDLLLR